jgi:hypothetical protein
LEPKYNILKIAGSLTGFRHSEASIELIRASKLGRNLTEEAKLKIASGNVQAQPVIVTDNKTGENKEFTSVRKAAEFIGKHHSYIAKCIKKHTLYKGEEYTIVPK